MTSSSGAAAAACGSSRSSVTEHPRAGTVIAIHVPPTPAAGESFAAALSHVDQLLAVAGALLELVPPSENTA